ncbi:MAG: hypothetical protein AB7Q97_23000 [Gammaproteobacteria bacterium]
MSEPSALAPMKDMPLPVKVEQVTAQWLTEALAFRFPGTQVLKAEVVDIVWGTSTKIRMALEYDARGRAHGLPPSMIVKGGFQEHSRSMWFTYFREMQFYRDMQPYVTLNSPRCYYAGRDPSPDAFQSIVVMEDLKAKGVEFCHAQRPQRFDQVARRLDAMALYHKQMWDHPGFQPGGQFEWLMKNLTGSALEYCERYLVPEVWQHYIDSPRCAAISVRLHDRAWMQNALYKLAAFHEQFPRTLVEGDTHLGNLYIEADGTPGFFDMQINRAPWFHDVTYHLICALDIPDRRAWERPLLMHYLDSLRRHGLAQVPSFDEAFDCYRRDIVWGLFIFMINEVNFQTEAINTAYAARFADAAIEHDTIRLMS